MEAAARPIFFNVEIDTAHFATAREYNLISAGESSDVTRDLRLIIAGCPGFSLVSRPQYRGYREVCWCPA